MILSDVDETRSRRLALVGKVPDGGSRINRYLVGYSDGYAAGYAGSLRDRLRESSGWLRFRRVSRADRAAVSRRLGGVVPSRLTVTRYRWDGVRVLVAVAVVVGVVVLIGEFSYGWL